MSETDMPSTVPVLENSDDQELVFNPEGMRILALDANVVSLTYLVAVLRKCKYEVTSTTKADEALRILRESKEKYDLVITDVVRLDIDGFTLSKIVSLEVDVPVILVTAEDDQSSIMKGILHGASGYLLKPVRVNEVRNIWHHVVRKRLSTTKKSSISANIKSKEELKPSNLVQKKVVKTDDEKDTNDEEEEEANNTINGRSSSQKKARLRWSQELQMVHPKKILEIMDEPGLTRDQVASHLQKYRMTSKKQKEKTNQLQSLNSKKSIKHIMDMKYTVPYPPANQDLFQLQQNSTQSSIQSHPWTTPDLAVPEFKGLKFSPTFFSSMMLPAESYNIHSNQPAASSGFPFCSLCASNACFNPPPQVPGQASIKAGAISQFAIASGHGQNSVPGHKGDGYFVNHTSNSGGQVNHCSNNYVQYQPSLPNLMSNESPIDDDLTQLVKQFANDDPPKL